MFTKNTGSSVENMLHTFQSNDLLVSEPHFFGVPISEYFDGVEYNGDIDAMPQTPFVVNREIGQEIMAHFTDLNVYQPNPTFFGIPVEEYLARFEKDIWQQILDETRINTLVLEQA